VRGQELEGTILPYQIFPRTGALIPLEVVRVDCCSSSILSRGKTGEFCFDLSSGRLVSHYRRCHLDGLCLYSCPVEIDLRKATPSICILGLYSDLNESSVSKAKGRST